MSSKKKPRARQAEMDNGTAVHKILDLTRSSRGNFHEVRNNESVCSPQPTFQLS
jgi:hypothetical protein